jgi:iron-sulfur cluster repair protein YtfE (RIC family)
MRQLNLNRSGSNLAMPGTRLGSNVQTRTDGGGIGRVTSPLVAGAKMTKRPASSLLAMHVVGRTNRTEDVWRTTKITDLCSYFEHDIHIRLRNQLATMTGVVAAAVATYADSQQNVREIYGIFFQLRERLWMHIFRGEHGLYSSIGNIERNWVKAYCRSSVILRPIRAVRREHRYFRKSFRRIDGT